MKNNLLRNSILLVAVLFTSSMFAQDWVKMMQDPTTNFFDVQSAFNKYYAKAERQIEKEKRKARKSKGENLSEEEIEVPGFSQYKRWEWYMAPRVSPSGERPAANTTWNAMVDYKKGIQTMGTGGAGTWTFIGPSATGALPGAGRLNRIVVNPTTSSTIYACSPAGGLWKSTNGGTSWTTNTDQLPSVIGCSDVAFDPTNANIMYLATGDGEAGDNSTVGLLKSTDGGNTWGPTGLTFYAASGRVMSRVIVDPTNGNNIYVATSQGVHKSTDGGATWAMVQAGSFKSMELKPGTPSTIFACGVEFFYSTNSGTTWTKATGFPAAANLCRMSLAVSANSPTTVYVNAGKAAPAYGEDGFYKSTNSGVSFTKVSTPSNFGNQEWYDLPIAASPTNAQEVMIGGQTIFYRSTNGGTSWTQVASNTHVDYHGITYDANGINAYIASDGGAYKSTNSGASWSDINNNLAISEMYGFGQSSTNANLLIQGWQDNGTNLYSGSWQNAMGGDGMLAFISHGSDQNMWGSQYNGSLNRSTNGGSSWGACGAVGGEGCPWVTEWNEDPTTANTIYVGCGNVWKSTNGGVSFTKPGNVAGTSTVTITAIGVSPASSQVMWTGKGGSLYKTTNGGTTWTVVSALPQGTISDIVCHPTDVNKAWISMSGFSAKNKVFQTTDQGATWTNLSASVPNISVNCMAIDKNGNDAVYLGTDVGCFFKDATMTIWQPFSNGLPNVIVSQLDIFYSGSKIRASTYGRGMWESGLYAPGAYPPDANFGADKFIGCPGLGVQYTDYSAGNPTSWSWVFQGGNPATSNQQNPFVAYNTAGTFSTSLTVTNANGTDSQTFTSLITISASGTAPTASSYTICGPIAVTLTATPTAGPGTLRWWNQSAGGTSIGTGSPFTTTLWGTQTLYVDEAFTTTSLDFVGPPDNTIGAGSIFSASDIRGLYFDVLKPVIINKVKVYAQTAGLRTIEILDANGNLVTDTTVNIPASPTTPATVTINRTVYPGTNFFMKFRGTVDCFRNNAGAAYPYTDGGSNAVIITNSNAGSPGYYYFFYDWQFTNIVCNTGRTPVPITDNCSLTGVNDLFTTNQLDVYPNPNNGEFVLSFNTTNTDNYSIKVTNTIGQIVYQEKLNDFSGAYANKIDISSFTKGVYMLSVSNSKNETVKKVVMY